MALRLAVAAVFCVFLWRGHPLARQWAMFVAVLYLLVMGVAIVALLGCANIHLPDVTLVGLILCAPPVLVFAGLVPRSSQRFFDLHCAGSRSGPALTLR